MSASDPQQPVPMGKRNGNPDPVFLAHDELKPELSENIALVDYWRSLPRAPGKAPLNSDFDLLDVPHLLGACLILDLEGPTTWPIKLFGSDLVTHFGIDATGLNGYDLYPPEEREAVTTRLHTMSERAAIMLTHSRLKNAADVTIRTEWVFLPLANEAGKVERVLISIAAFDRATDHNTFEMNGTMNDRRLLKLVYACD